MNLTRTSLIFAALLATTPVFAQSSQVNQDKQQLKKDQAKEVNDGNKAWNDLGKQNAATKKAIHNNQNLGDRTAAQKAAQQTQNDLKQFGADEKQVAADKSKLNAAENPLPTSNSMVHRK